MPLGMLLAALWATGPDQSLALRTRDLYRSLEKPGVKLVVDTLSLPRTLPPPPGTRNWTLERDGGPRPSGTEALVVRWQDGDGRTLGTQRVLAKVRRLEWTPFARSRLLRGTSGDSAALRWEWTQAPPKAAPPPDSAHLSRLRLRRAAGPDQPLRGDAWEEIPSVQPGQLLTVVSHRLGLTARVEGTAQGTGTTGSTIHVQTPFGKRILCRIQEDGTALSLE